MIDSEVHDSCSIKEKIRITRAEARAAIDGLRDEAADMPEMTLEEINEEIKAARAARAVRSPALLRENLQ